MKRRVYRKQEAGSRRKKYLGEFHIPQSVKEATKIGKILILGADVVN